MLTAAGYRYRLHNEGLPGKPDIVFGSLKRCIFVHGCFWHQHECSRGRRTPKSNQDYWTKKLNRNRTRDKESLGRLAELGWQVEIVWECELTDLDNVLARLVNFLKREALHT